MSKLEHIHVKLSFKQKGNLQMKDERFLLINLKLYIPKQRYHISNSQSMSSSSEKHLSLVVSNLMIRHDKSVEISWRVFQVDCNYWLLEKLCHYSCYQHTIYDSLSGKKISTSKGKDWLRMYKWKVIKTC